MKPPAISGSKAGYVGEMFARISGRYDLLNTAMTLGMHHRWKRRVAAIAVGEGEGRALDVATGTGDLAIELALRPGTSEVVGVDFCPEMLELARRKSEKRPPPRPVTFLLGDALRLAFPDDSFLCATSGFALRNVDSIERSISEMFRVVRPGGRVVVLELTPRRSRNILSPLLNLYFNHWVPLLGQLLAGDREAYTYLPDSVTGFPDAEELATLFRNAGMVEVGYRRMNMGAVAIHWGAKPPG
ncbi:MAG: ubiquinone/menaquinone biosynthesis methyltransferase [Dehalococcoidia bacterium]